MNKGVSSRRVVQSRAEVLPSTAMYEYSLQPCLLHTQASHNNVAGMYFPIRPGFETSLYGPRSVVNDSLAHHIIANDRKDANDMVPLNTEVAIINEVPRRSGRLHDPSPASSSWKITRV